MKGRNPVAVIVTAPPYAGYLSEVASHPLVCGFRLNTVMPLRETPQEVLRRLSELGKPLWVDLKGRQLRVVGAAIPPYTEVRISHKIKVTTPVNAFFSDGTEHARIVAVDGDRLILDKGPRRLIGPGESINIVDPSLQIEDTLTETDVNYLAAMKSTGLNKVLLSYVEMPEDVAEVKSHLPEAEVMLKIETQKGVEFAGKNGNRSGRLVAARGDLFVEMNRPHQIIGALQNIIRADPTAVAASRILNSLATHPVPGSADISDVAYLFSLGYRTLMLGDSICFDRNTLIEALNLLDAISQQICL